MTKDDAWWTEEVGRQARVTFDLIGQAADSPDEDVLDLGLSRPPQSLQSRQKPAMTTDGLIADVQEAHMDCNGQLPARDWHTHQIVMDEVTQRDGGSGHKTPHIDKAGVVRTHHCLPDHCPASRVAVGHLRRAGLL